MARRLSGIFRSPLFSVYFRRACWGVPIRALCLLIVTAFAQAQSALTFQSTQIKSDTGIGQILTGDFNDDGNPDLVFLQQFRITVVLGNGDGTFRPPIHAPVTATPDFIWMAVGDFNNDGKLDVVVFASGSGASAQYYVQTYLGKGDGTFAEPIGSRLPVYFSGPAIVGDVNRDGNLDLIGPGIVLLGVGEGTFEPPIRSNCPGAYDTPPGASLTETDFAVASFKNNRTFDFAFVYASEVVAGALFDSVFATGTVCLGNSDGTFTAGPTVYTSNTEASSSTIVPGYFVTTGDFNGDGNADVLVTLESAGGRPVNLGYSVIFGNGDGTFQPAVSRASLYTSTSTANLPKPVVADMNGDGKSDLIQAVPGGLSILLSSGDGNFTGAADLFPGQPAAIAVADFNNDGLPDIVSSTKNLTSVLINTSRRVDSIVNAASLDLKEPVAPGSLVTIRGAGLGPSPGVLSRTGVNGSLPLSLADVSVTFNGKPAPLLYVSSRQVNVQVPWEISGEADVAVSVGGASTAVFKVPTEPIAPGIFNTPDPKNGGSGATSPDPPPLLAFAFNSDGTIAGQSGSIAGIPSHPAKSGDTITVLANGLGPVTPSITDGVPSNETVRHVGPTPVFIGGIRCPVSFAGLSASQVGVNQLRVVVPDGVHGIVPIQINAGHIITSRDVIVVVQ